MHRGWAESHAAKELTIIGSNLARLGALSHVVMCNFVCVVIVRVCRHSISVKTDLIFMPKNLKLSTLRNQKRTYVIKIWVSKLQSRQKVLKDSGSSLD
jgi:hypothetical protein